MSTKKSDSHSSYDHNQTNAHTHDHHHDHDHSHGLHHHHGDIEGNRKGLIIALIITASIMVLEFFGGLITNSLALLSDSGHMLSDASSLLFSLIAFYFAAKAASPKRTYGFHRFEILAALLNGATLFFVAGIIIVEAFKRFVEPPTVASGSMILIACIGLLANLLSAYFLMRKGDVKNNINMRSAYLHVIGDALGSVGAIVAGVIMLAFKWYYADPIISVIVALLILRGAWGVLKQAVHILMEGTPYHIDQAKVLESLGQIPHVLEVHDLHIWTITSNLEALSCHLVIEEHADQQAVLQQALALIASKFAIEHSTIQIETPSFSHEPLKV
ncbi:MAG: cation diffusion facilitator family transporter [Candidatus Pristimantibacillus lignocellulolyticus]|uniref:Cation diffusion facilitator family transporter n=1 Tax=Candidatus Pristimantibacillus lignocellulolyticus TaxID=2994561 RepID=A0A9J6Z982_9BACL|nr:MAG: cation diffusion facilitator family transporter [Candidatus Pristimantibacillus lignocellulolyticus]